MCLTTMNKYMGLAKQTNKQTQSLRTEEVFTCASLEIPAASSLHHTAELSRKQTRPYVWAKLMTDEPYHSLDRAGALWTLSRRMVLPDICGSGGPSEEGRKNKKVA